MRPATCAASCAAHGRCPLPSRLCTCRLRCLLVCRRLKERLPQRSLAIRLPLDAAALADATRQLARHAPWLEGLAVRADTAAAAPDVDAVDAACSAGYPCKLKLAAAQAGSPAKATCFLQLPAMPKLKRLEVASPEGKFIRLSCRRGDRGRL